MNLVSRLAERAATHPERPALIDSPSSRDRIITFGELARRVAAGAALLDRAGIGRGKTILVFQPVSIELYEILLAAFHNGARVMLADPSAGRDFLSLCCQRLAPDAFFGPWNAHCLRLAVPALREIRTPIRSCAWFPGARSWDTRGPAAPIADVDDDEPALITFTSGSTGVPKAAVRTHGFLLAQHHALSEALDFREGEVDLVTLPVFVLANLASGLTSVLAATDLSRPGFPDCEAVLSQCRRHRVTRCAASPAFFAAFLANQTPLRDLEKIHTGGAPVFPDLLHLLAATTPGAVIEAVYGSTEAEPIAHFNAAHETPEIRALTSLGGGLCAGTPIPRIHLRIMRDHWGQPIPDQTHDSFSSLLAAPGQAGEIIVSGDHVLPGYLDGLGDSETKIHVENQIWHRTGDAGWLDPQGRLWLLGRCSEKLPPFTLPDAPALPTDALRYSFAIECAFRETHPGCRMAAIDWNGVRALVLSGSTESEKLAAIQHLARRYGIDRVITTWAIPLDRRHNAKIDYPALRRQLNDSLTEP